MFLNSGRAVRPRGVARADGGSGDTMTVLLCMTDDDPTRGKPVRPCERLLPLIHADNRTLRAVVKRTATVTLTSWLWKVLPAHDEARTCQPICSVAPPMYASAERTGAENAVSPPIA